MPPSAEPGLTPWAARALDELHACDRWASDLARGLNTEQLNWRPAPDAWSVGQCLHHLYVASEHYLPPMAKALDGRPTSRVNEITPGWFARWFIRNYIAPPEPGDRPRTRGRAPGKIVPAVKVDPSILDQLLRSNDSARELIRRASAYDVNRIRFANPFVPLVRFTVGTGVEVIWKHQRRHLAQAERILKSAAFPTT